MRGKSVSIKSLRVLISPFKLQVKKFNIKESSGRLEFYHDRGACTNMADQFIYLCFNVYSTSDYKICRKSATPTGNYDEISKTTHDHKETRIASSSRKFKVLFLLMHLQ